MKIQSPPGMRDFYPDDMRRQRWLFDLWRDVSLACGCEEYEGPIFEYLDLYTVKSGEGIVSELFNFTDRGERRFAIRPEMTPTLARMVAARANALSRPIKWFSVPRMCRAEKPQRGRLREFFQWNVDILGVDDVLADAEVIAVAVEFLRRVGLTPADVVMRISSRPLATAVLGALGVEREQVGRAFELIDRFDKLGVEEFRRQWQEFAPRVSPDGLLEQLERTDLAGCLRLLEKEGDAGTAARQQFEELWERLRALDVVEYCAFDLKVVRGLAYYTGPVFEVTAQRGGLRALLGGGRYDNLTELLDGPRVSGVGFGMGDAPVLECLRELSKLPDLSQTLDLFVMDAGGEYFDRVLEIATQLRRAGLTVDFSYKRQAIGKQFKQASGRGARYAIVVGGEYDEKRQLTVKNLSTGEQEAVSAEKLLADPRALLASI
ncbi:MAG: histidine--tRNA ligase [Phycisphaerae bacterium]|jgi:histidyl-tRNA synthetase